MQNAVYAITALRWQGADIEQAMMGLLDVERMQWDFKPAPTRTCNIIDRLLEGDTVIALVQEPTAPARERRMLAQLGPDLQVGLSPDGAETLAPADDARDDVLQALPRF